MRPILIIGAITALGIVPPSSAQEVDQTTRQQLEQLMATNVENWNKQDATGIASLYTKEVFWSSLT